MTHIQDYMFGENILPHKRLEAHQLALSGVHHHTQAHPARPRPAENLFFYAHTSSDISVERVRLFYTLDGSTPSIGKCQVQDFVETGVSWDQIGWQYVRHWQTRLPGQPDDTLIRYRIAAQGIGSQTWIFADNQAQNEDQATNFALWISALPDPGWVEQAMIYHVFIDRFYPGAGREWNSPANLGGFFGGTLRGIQEKLDYIQDLGYDVIWLSPFFSSPSHHGYDATDLYTVEPRLGTNQDLYQLIDAAHQRGMRIILDFVANHWSNLHPSMQAAQKDPHSPTKDWYLWKNWPDDYQGFFGVKEMPQLNLVLGSPARQYLLDAARFWLEKGFDGYRLDYASGPPGDFWVDFRRVCKKTRADCWLFGEVIDSATAQQRFAPAFDGMIDFLLTEAVRQTFGYGRWELDRFDAFLTAHERFFEGMFDRLIILDNHDMNRFLFLAGDDQRRLMLGALLLYTLPGTPINYYGTEAGVTQTRPTHENERGFFEEARQPMLWGSQANPILLDYIRKLTSLRRAYPALRGGSRRTLHLDAQANTYAYLRQLGHQYWVVAFNLSQEPRAFDLTFPGVSSAWDRLNQIPIQTGNGMLQLKLVALSGAVLELKGNWNEH